MTRLTHAMRAGLVVTTFLAATGAANAQADRTANGAGGMGGDAARADNRNGFEFNPGWLGLIGLAGLAGLTGKSTDRHTDRVSGAAMAR